VSCVFRSPNLSISEQAITKAPDQPIKLGIGQVLAGEDNARAAVQVSALARAEGYRQPNKPNAGAGSVLPAPERHSMRYC
jgi:hypothetical protein